MRKTQIAAGLAALALLPATALHAGGLERGGYNIDQLFDAQPFTFQSGVVYVSPHRKLKNAAYIDASGTSANGSRSADQSENFAIPYIGLKAGLGPVDCLFDYSQPFGAHTNPGSNWAGAQDEIATKLKSDNYGATCSYKFDIGPGQFRLIGGGFYQEIEGWKERLVAPIPFPASLAFDGTGRLSLSDEAWGWRAGMAYEIPEYAVRASLVYNSRVKYDNLVGTLDLTQVPAVLDRGLKIVGVQTPVRGSAEAPDSVELKIQSGIAPDWLAFGSVKWTNWSLLQSIAFCPTNGKSCIPGGVTSLDLLYRDGVTVTGGVGHKFTDQWAGAVSLTWDRGTSTGYGSQTDSWTLGVGAAYTPTEHIEWRVAGALGVLTGGSSFLTGRDGDVISYSFDDDLVAAISTSIKFKF